MIMSRWSVDALRMLIAQESHRLSQKIESLKGKKFVIFPAAPAARRFFYTLKKEYGIEAEFFVDNNPALEGKSLCGKPIKSPKAIIHGGGMLSSFPPLERITHRSRRS
jgi:hypothetical protein